ncbi:hypothetical protein WJX84_003722 [Apatococcus fuscideae]|uniref:Alpha-ketoglutarate-dependent dioxygenase AlkB-like domain-containing protein n=1 Tax=Apatococcus fuscideae TaxID=2026836 RepID=A0AAW1T1F1_9CHLO
MDHAKRFEPSPEASQNVEGSAPLAAASTAASFEPKGSEESLSAMPVFMSQPGLVMHLSTPAPVLDPGSTTSPPLRLMDYSAHDLAKAPVSQSLMCQEAAVTHFVSDEQWDLSHREKTAVAGSPRSPLSELLSNPTCDKALLRAVCSAAAHSSLPGQSLFKDFISESEEAELLDLVDNQLPQWKNSNFNGAHRGKAWGVRMDLAKRTVLTPTVLMPPILLRIAKHMRCLPLLAKFHPNEANAIDYQRSCGNCLKPHVDDRQMSTEFIVNLSLAGACTMTFTRPGKAPRNFDVLLPRRSLQVTTKEARYTYTHSIDLRNFHDPRRVSITFRQSPLRS